MQGSESDYERGEQLARNMFSPIERTHRITVDQMAILEPALSETVAVTLLSAIKDAMDEAVSRGVPEAAARDFILGHIGVELSIIFGHIDAQLSNGAIMAARRAAQKILNPDWKKVFEPESIMTEIREITGGE
jgi:D-apionate oxidoisomerase